jgi:hypothetical protein
MNFPHAFAHLIVGHSDAVELLLHFFQPRTIQIKLGSLIDRSHPDLDKVLVAICQIEEKSFEIVGLQNARSLDNFVHYCGNDRGVLLTTWMLIASERVLIIASDL